MTIHKPTFIPLSIVWLGLTGKFPSLSFLIKAINSLISIQDVFICVFLGTWWKFYLLKTSFGK